MELSSSPEYTQSVYVSFLRPLRQRDFLALWLGQTFSQFGDAILWVALPLTVYSMGRSALQMGFIMGLLMLPQVLLLPFAGILVDRASRSQLMMSADLVRFLLLTGLTFLAGTHHLTMPLLDGFVLLFGAMDALFQPAYSAARAEVFYPEIRNAANGLTQVSQQFARLLGPAVAGVIIGFASVAAGFAVDAATLFISVVSLLFLRLRPPLQVTDGSTTGFRRFGGELVDGYRELRKSPWLYITIVAFAFMNIANNGIIAILLPWLIKVHFGLSATTYGLISSASGVGAISAAIGYGRRTRWRRRSWIAYGGVAASGISGLALAFAHTTVLFMLISAVSGAGLMLFGLTWEGSLQELIAPHAFGRVASLDMFGSFALLPIGNVLTGWLAVKIGGVITLGAEGVFILLIAVAVLLVPGVRRFD